ncbi:putative mitochondrial protein, partial [Mucuna pruriens]
MLDCKPCGFPMEPHHGLFAEMGESYLNPSQYRHLIGHLIYITITRLEIAYSIHILTTHSSLGQGFLLSKHGNLKLTGYCDLDWASYPTTRRSISGYIIKLRTNSISWKTKKKMTILCLSCEDEYRVMSHATNEVIWLQSLLSTLQVPYSDPTPLFCDNYTSSTLKWIVTLFENTYKIEDKSFNTCPPSNRHKQFHHLLSKLEVHDLHSLSSQGSNRN